MCPEHFVDKSQVRASGEPPPAASPASSKQRGGVGSPMSPAAPRGASHARGKTYGGGLLDNPVQIAYRRRSGSAGTREGVADGAGALRLERLRNPSSHRDGSMLLPHERWVRDAAGNDSERFVDSYTVPAEGADDCAPL